MRIFRFLKAAHQHTSGQIKLSMGLTCCLLALTTGCRPVEGRNANDPSKYPACDAGSYPYIPDKNAKGPGTPQWIRRFGCQGDDRATGVVVEQDGSVVATGSFAGRISFGDLPITNGGQRDAFVAKWDSKGKLQWNLRFGGVNSEASGTNIVLGAGGELIVSGRFRGVLDATRPQLMSRAMDPFVLMVDPDGEFVWGKSFERSGANDESKLPIAVDPEGGMLMPAAPGRAERLGSVLRLDRAGQTIGRVTLQEGIASSVAVREDKSVLVVGYSGQSRTEGSTSRRGGTPGTERGGSSLFISNYDINARRTWVRTIGSSRAGTVKSFGEPVMAVDAVGSCYLAFAYQGVLDLGAGGRDAELLDSGTGFDIVLMKLDTSGQTLWATAFPGPQGNEWVSSISVHRSGDIVVGGSFERAVDFGGGPIMSIGPLSGFVVRLDTMGHHLWSRVVGGQGSSAVVESVAFGLEKRVAVAGSFRGWTDFGTGLVPASGQWDGFVAVYGP
ncbi:MAG: hypothetical protein FWD57_14225 [Polyangiaceae bacterium]|nr:hypothetical protein [Polyangiaceae bacterium]